MPEIFTILLTIFTLKTKDLALLLFTIQLPFAGTVYYQVTFGV
jgi:hypothetical protein